ncbi:MAG: hypothetical protein ACODTU_19800 [Pigmentiphaga sp.]|uniref:hypothetical protein n=1 Tax=Pigmentiphaga sp. TaxID=1977564 RepID=UPI003B551662
MQYKLVDRRPVPCADSKEWWEWFRTTDRHVADTRLDDIRVSTAFLGLEHNPLPDGRPALFETEMNVNGEANPLRRYAVWEDAEAGHAEIVRMIKAEIASAGGSSGESARKVGERVVQRIQTVEMGSEQVTKQFKPD